MFGDRIRRKPALFRVEPNEAYDRVSSGRSVLIEVRPEPEWRRTGRPAGSRAISLQADRFVRSVSLAVDADLRRPVILTCATGKRSGQAADRLAEAGFADLAVLEGGIGAWRRAGLPTEGEE